MTMHHVRRVKLESRNPSNASASRVSDRGSAERKFATASEIDKSTVVSSRASLERIAERDPRSRGSLMPRRARDGARKIHSSAVSRFTSYRFVLIGCSLANRKLIKSRIGTTCACRGTPRTMIPPHRGPPEREPRVKELLVPYGTIELAEPARRSPRSPRHAAHRVW